MANETSKYSFKQELFYTVPCILNDTLRFFDANPSPLLDHHLWDFSYGALLTSIYFSIRPQDKDSKIGQIASITIPTTMLSLYEFASQNQYVFGTYDPKDIPAYALGSVAAYAGVKLFSTKESRGKVKNFFGKLNPFTGRKFSKKNLESIMTEE